MVPHLVPEISSLDAFCDRGAAGGGGGAGIGDSRSLITKPHRPESIPRLIVQVKPVCSNDSKNNIGLSTTGQDLGVGDVHFS